MILKQVQKHLSIRNLPRTELPSLTVLTGVNGAGKTHLLHAIQAGHVKVDCAPNHEADIKFFDWNKLVPNNAGQVQLAQIYSERDQLCDQVRNARRQREDHYRSRLSELGLLNLGLPDMWAATDKTETELIAHLGDESKGRNAFNLLQVEAATVTQLVKQNYKNQHSIMRLVDRLIGERGHLATVDEAAFSSRPFGWNHADVFQQSFAEMFLAYFELSKNNRLRQLMVSQGETPDTPPLASDEFRELHGDPPWDFVNKTLLQAGLNFEIDHPQKLDVIKYQPELKKRTSGAIINFGDLSSGEKVLMSFAFCLYYSLDKRQSVSKPKLLLFDEIDAPLHPSMSRVVMKTIKEVLVEQEKLNVILVTHSPSTVAVAPDEAIHLIEPDTNKITKETKRRAVSTLTAEIPTLSISFNGRRQIFVESQSDAERYERLYLRYSPHIESERSLVFIGVGGKGADNRDAGSGCDQVKRVVKQLVQGGNESVFGLIDWDGENQGSDRVKVLAEGKRYAIENCLLDPLLIGAAALRADRKLAEELGFPGLSYTGLKDLNNPELQRFVDAIQGIILSAPRSPEDSVMVQYQGGASLQISKQYLQMRGHDLQERATSVFLPLRGVTRSNALLMHVVDPILADHPTFLPLEIIEAFKILSEQEIVD